MYIPTNFFSNQTSLAASGGVESLWVSGGYVWKSHRFDVSTGTGSFSISTGTTNNGVLLLVGAGGSRGSGIFDTGPTINHFGAGGGGGVLQYDNISLVSGSYSVRVGPAVSFFSGSFGPNGSGSFFSGSAESYSVLGGGGGGSGIQSRRNGRNGGSGGGAGANGTQGFGETPPRQGFDGGLSWIGIGGSTFGGGGGGAGSSAGSNGRPGVGRISHIANGLTMYYAGGGQGISTGSAALGAFGRGGGIADDNSQRGCVIVAYPYFPINLYDTELARFTPTVSGSGLVLEYVEVGTGQLKKIPVSYGLSYDVCIVRNSQWTIYSTSSQAVNELELTDPVNFFDDNLYANGTKTTIALNSATCTSAISPFISHEMFYSDDSSSICTTTTSGSFYQAYSGSLSIGNKLYYNASLTSAVTASYFRKSNQDTYYVTNSTGSIYQTGECLNICQSTIFTAGPSGGTAFYYQCGGTTLLSASLSGSEVRTICIRKNQYRELSGAGSNISVAGSC